MATEKVKGALRQIQHMLPGCCTGLVWLFLTVRHKHLIDSRVKFLALSHLGKFHWRPQLDLALPAFPQHHTSKATGETFSVGRAGHTVHGSRGSSTGLSLVGLRCPFPLQHQKFKPPPPLSHGMSILYTFSNASI